MLNMYLDCGLNCRLVWLKLKLIENKRLSRHYISWASCKQCYANFSWHSGSSSRQSVAWRPKWELCCILLLTSNKVPLKAKSTSRQINFCLKILMICFFFVEETFDHVLSDEIDHVSLMFISEHESMQIWDAKWMFAYFVLLTLKLCCKCCFWDETD